MLDLLFLFIHRRQCMHALLFLNYLFLYIILAIFMFADQPTLAIYSSIYHPNRLMLSMLWFYISSEFVLLQWLIDPTRDDYIGSLDDIRTRVNAPNHKTSPIVWTQDDFVNDNASTLSYLGGRDDTIAWCRKYLQVNDKDLMGRDFVMKNDNYDTNHQFQYDLVVIGGGSGNLFTCQAFFKWWVVKRPICICIST